MGLVVEDRRGLLLVVDRLVFGTKEGPFLFFFSTGFFFTSICSNSGLFSSSSLACFSNDPLCYSAASFFLSVGSPCRTHGSERVAETPFGTPEPLTQALIASAAPPRSPVPLFAAFCTGHLFLLPLVSARSLL